MEIKERFLGYREGFFFGEVQKVVRSYDFQGGLFVVGKSGNDLEVFWGVDDLFLLREGLKRVNNDFPEFRFRYAGPLNLVREKKEEISGWGFRAQEMNVGYVLNMEEIEAKGVDVRVMELEDIDAFMFLERSIFPHFNLEREELGKWVKDDRYIALVLDRGGIQGFVLLELYGGDHCFVRNLAVREDLT